MLDLVNNHPFAVDAFFKKSMVLTFAVPSEQLASLLPECLVLDTFADHWAFLAVALVQTKALRPGGFPSWLGQDFFLIGYRIFVRYTTSAGKRLRGLYILKSETDQKRMERLGNLFTHYHYSTTDIHQQQTDSFYTVQSNKSGMTIRVNTDAATAHLPNGSPFNDWKEARRFAGPLPFTFSYKPTTRQVLIVEGVREFWQPQPVSVLDHHVAYLGELGLTNYRLASAFVVENIPYHWKRGRFDVWNG